jgi:hypothetical protein
VTHKPNCRTSLPLAAILLGGCVPYVTTYQKNRRRTLSTFTLVAKRNWARSPWFTTPSMASISRSPALDSDCIFPPARSCN